MQDLINGGIYSINLKGNTSADFIGEHPTLIVRTLKESEIFFVVPLTTYTKEKWLKCKSKGFGCRIKSTNSIARIDKVKIIHKREIKLRWFTNDKFLIITPDELDSVCKRLVEYIGLSCGKLKKEYCKYYEQYYSMLNECKSIFDEFDFTKKHIFEIYFNSAHLVCRCNLNKVNKLSIHDINEIFRRFFDKKNLKVVSKKSCQTLFVNILKRDAKVLTFKGKYDSIKVQKG